MKKYTYEEALHRAAALCSMAEKSEADIRRKLSDWGIDDVESAHILSHLRKEKFLDETRFATAFVRDKFRFSQWGRVKIAYALRQKEVSEAIVADALCLIDDDEYAEVLLELLRNKKKSLKSGSDYEKSAKLVRFAQSRGFESDIIFKTIKKLL